MKIPLPPPEGLAATLARIRSGIAFHRFSFDNEIELQDGLEIVFREAGLVFQREAPILERDRIDFLVAPKIGVEVKIAGSLAAVTRQIFRYAGDPSVDALVLVTSRSVLSGMPHMMNRKPIHVCVLPRTFA